eukprot:gene2368-4590_t
MTSKFSTRILFSLLAGLLAGTSQSNRSRVVYPHQSSLFSSPGRFFADIISINKKTAGPIQDKRTEIAGRSAISVLNEINSDRRVVLGSASPRRLELLRLMGLKNVEVCVSGFEENLNRNNFECAADYCLETATQKCYNVAKVMEQDNQRPMILIGADTIVEIGGEILEKPKNEADAYRMLSLLSNSIHLVHTGVTVLTNTDTSRSSMGNPPLSLALSFVQTTKVKFIELSDSDINAYIESGEPFDKAGAYGIQGLGGQFVDYIEGCYFNVMGLPISSLSRQLVELKNRGQL